MNAAQKRLGAVATLLTAQLCAFAAAGSAEHPRLLLAADEMRELEDSWAQSPLFASAVRRAEQRIAPHLEQLPDVPRPADPGGGYTHERHKANGIVIAEAGALFQWTGDAAYAALVRGMLFAYADLYPTLEAHPQAKKQAPGRLFWQHLNESVWLVYAIQGYDAAYDALDEADRQRIESRLLRPMARFLSHESAHVFDRIHNHGTWATAAVGMTGYALDDADMVQAALLGTRGDGEGGFLAQLRQLFSPDGYYLEGPYYQRYALMPFVVFAAAIERNEPQRGIFAYRGGIVGKAIRTAVQLSYAGRFFPVNDAIADKGLDTVELDHAIAIAYARDGDPAFLSLVDAESHLVLTGDGYRLARDKEAGLEKPFPFASRHFRDGAAGDQGALTVLRTGRLPGHSALVFKATSHGMGHGHFDRLHWLFYDNGAEVVADYGAARFLNVEQKDGGRYLPENATWAKQTVAHNTLVVDGQSQFGGNVRRAEGTWPGGHYYAAEDGVRIVSAFEDAAYPHTALRRTMLLIDWPTLDQPLVVDVLRADSAAPRRFDLPLYFKGQLIEAAPRLDAKQTLAALGDDSGYQHLWLLGAATAPAAAPVAITWLQHGRFYTYRVVANAGLQALFVRVGAGDPAFNLRPEHGFVFRAERADDLVLVAVLEPHGEYSGAREYTIKSTTQIADVQRFGGAGKDLVVVTATNGSQLAVALAYDGAPDRRHAIAARGRDYQWRGFHHVFGG